MAAILSRPQCVKKFYFERMKNSRVNVRRNGHESFIRYRTYGYIKTKLDESILTT